MLGVVRGVPGDQAPISIRIVIRRLPELVSVKQWGVRTEDDFIRQSVSDETFKQHVCSLTPFINLVSRQVLVFKVIVWIEMPRER